MEKLRVEGNIVTYSSLSGNQDIVYFAPYEDKLYICTVCQQEFAAWQEDLLYRRVQDTINMKYCPICYTPLNQSLVEQKRIPWDDTERISLDDNMRTKGYTIIVIQKGVWKEFFDVFSI